MIEIIIDIYFRSLFFLFVIFLFTALFYWTKLFYYIYYNEPKYWNKLYNYKVYPKWRTFFRFYYGKEDFGDKKIKHLKQKVRLFFLLLILTITITVISMVLLGIFLY